MLGLRASSMPEARAAERDAAQSSPTMSTIEQSITQPLPARAAAKTALMTPNARPSAPPPSPMTVGGGDRRRVRAGGERQRAAQREIVEVVSRDLRERAVLPPAGHAAVDEPRIALRAVGGAEAKALHDAGPIALDQRVGRLDQRQRLLDRFRALEIERRRSVFPAAADSSESGRSGSPSGRLVRANDRDDLRAEVGEHAAGERTGPDALELDDASGRQADESFRAPGVELIHGSSIEDRDPGSLRRAPGTAP